MRSDEYILCAAIHVQDDKSYEHQPKNIESGLVVCGRRHHNCYTFLSIVTQEYKKKCIQGFLTSKDRFVNRFQASRIACKAGQIKEVSDQLISEELY